MKSEPDSGYIWSAWNDGFALIGAHKPSSRITVEPGWMLHTQTTAGSRSSTKLPIRYFQKASNDQLEIEVPGLRSFDIGYSIDQDVATLTVKVTNNSLDPTYSAWADANGDFGRPGWLTPDRGDTVNRWGYEPNEWHGLLTRNSLIRSFEGYGGQDMTIPEAVAAGHLVLTGVWLVDDAPVQTGQHLTLQCTNMGKLLVSQYIFGPLDGIDGLVPAGDYPMSRYRFRYLDVFTPGAVYGHLALPPTFRILGIERTASGDGYWLVGTDGGIFSYGRGHFYGSADSVGVTIPTSTYPNEGVTSMARTATGEGYWLVTSDGLVYSFGDAIYHGGLSSPAPGPIVGIESAAPHDGYWLIDDLGQVYAFSGAVYLGGSPPLVSGAKIVDLVASPTGDGYWLVDDQGHVYSYGDCVYHGGLAVPPSGGPVTGMAATSTGGGYWMVATDGGVFAFGDATFYGSIPGISPPVTLNDPMSDIIGAPDDSGYLLTAEDGGVFVFPGGTTGPRYYGSLVGGEADEFTSPGNYCVDSETEILTPRGWLRFDAVEVGDEALAIDPSTGSAGWEEITDIFREHRQIKMISMKGRRHDSVSTLDHRWLTLDHEGRWVWRTTETLIQASRIPTAAPRHDVPSVAKFSDDFVEIIAWFYTEGSLADGRACVSQSRAANPSYHARMEGCLRRLYGEPGPLREGHLWNEQLNPTGVSIFRVKNTVREQWVEVAPDRVPTPEFLCALTTAQVGMFVDTSIDADGHRRLSNGVELFTQKDERRIRVFEMACVLAGRTPNTTLMFSKGLPFWSCTVRRGNTVAPVQSAHGNTKNHLLIERMDYDGIIWCPTLKHHNWLARRNGKVYFTGNTDYVDILKDLALYAGFYLYDGGATDGVYGVMETTGIYADDTSGASLDAVFFDKLPVIDPMHKIREVVGFLLTVDDEGGLHFHEPNFWASGNYFLDHTHTDTIPVIDERVQLTDYTRSIPDKDLRSSIIISTNDTEADTEGTITTSFVPATAGELRGMIRPAMWVNEVFNSTEIQQTMAQLIALQIYFHSRLGSVTCLGNPMIQIDDQVQILERETAETNTHYVRAHRRTHDHKSGSYLSQLTTHLLSPPGDWAVVKPEGSPTGSIVSNRII